MSTRWMRLRADHRFQPANRVAEPDQFGRRGRTHAGLEGDDLLSTSFGKPNSIATMRCRVESLRSFSTL